MSLNGLELSGDQVGLRLAPVSPPPVYWVLKFQVTQSPFGPLIAGTCFHLATNIQSHVDIVGNPAAREAELRREDC